METDKTLTLEAGGFEILAADAPTNGVQPALPKFKMVAYTGSQMRLGSWGDPVIVDVAGISIPTQKIPIRFGHEPGSGVGHTTSLAIEDGKLIAHGVVSRDTEEAREVVASAKNGFPWQISIGASADETERLREGETAEINGKKVRGPLSLVRKATLGEISFVDLGADRKTAAQIAAKAAKESTMPDNGTPEDVKKVEAGKVETPADPLVSARGAGPDIDDMIAEARRKRELKDLTIKAMSECEDDPEHCERLRDTCKRHIEAGTTVKDYQLVLLREQRPVAPPKDSRFGRSDLRTDSDVLAAAAMIAGLGEEVAVKAHGERAVEAARKRFSYDIGLQEIMLASAQANGYHGRQRVTIGNWREIWAFASGGGDIRAAGYSTVNLPNLLGSVANKAAAKVAADPSWIAPRITGVASHSNFHSHTVCSMGVNGTLEQVGSGGEIKNVRLSEETYTRQVSTRGAVLRLSRTDIINDDMGVFTKNAQMLVRKGYNAREKVLFTLINGSGAGSSHFTAARGNYITGATTVPGTITGMDAAVKAFRLLEDLDNDPVGVEPALVLVGPIYEASMNALLGAAVPALIATDFAASASTVGGATNIYSGRFGGKTLVSPWMEKTAAGGSASGTCWYLFADPQVLPCYEIAYLNGQQTPTVEYFGLESEADSLGVAWRIYWDFGVAAAEWRAGVKIAGA